MKVGSIMESCNCMKITPSQPQSFYSTRPQDALTLIFQYVLLLQTITRKPGHLLGM